MSARIQVIASECMYLCERLSVSASAHVHVCVISLEYTRVNTMYSKVIIRAMFDLYYNRYF